MAVIPCNRTAGYATMAGMNRLRLLIGILGLVVAMLLPGCRGEPTSPEAEVRALINSAVAAAEQKNIGMLKNLISKKYTDEQGQNKQAVEGLLRLHLLRNETVHLYAHIQSITLPQPERAQATILVAMAGVPIASAQELPTLRADLHRFDINFAREGKTWRVQQAAWRRAEPGEFLSP
jgi:hypothetical protein